MKRLSAAHNHIQYDLTIINRAEELFGSGCFREEISTNLHIKSISLISISIVFLFSINFNNDTYWP